MNKKFCIAFAGVVGSSKSPIAYFLSQNFNLPIFNNDAIRTEVTEDLLELNQEEFLKRRDQRMEDLMKSGKSFILDSSVDRAWTRFKEYLDKYEYTCFIISLDLSKGLLEKLYEAKGYTDSSKRLDQLLSEHEQFIGEFGTEISVHIHDEDFPRRLEYAKAELTKLLV